MTCLEKHRDCVLICLRVHVSSSTVAEAKDDVIGVMFLLFEWKVHDAGVCFYDDLVNGESWPDKGLCCFFVSFHPCLILFLSNLLTVLR